MALTDMLKDSHFIKPITGWRFTLDGKKISVLQNFTISASLQGDLLVEFDGERLDTYLSDDGRTMVKILDKDENGKYKEGKYGIMSYHKLSDKATEIGGKIVVKNITVDETGFPTFNLITIKKEKE